MSRNNELEQVYSTASYTWDGNNRPVLSNYTEPWSYYASQQPSSVLSKRQIQAIDYAKLRLQEATKQFEQDISFWNEQDERRYTTPSAQTQRYTDAGYNIGYLYGNVDSGNSSVGYDQQSTNIDTETSDAYEKAFDSAVNFVTSTVEAVSSLVNQGYNTKRIAQMTPYEIAKILAEGHSVAIDNTFKEYLNQIDMDGNALTGKFQDGERKSVMLTKVLEEIIGNQLSNSGQKLTNKQVQTYLKYYEQILQKEATPDAINSVNQYIDNQNIGPGFKAFLKVIAAALTD